jgi:hypothetical protein
MAALYSQKKRSHGGGAVHTAILAPYSAL